MCLMMTQTCLFYWCIGCIGQIYRTAVQEQWNRTVLYINATSVDLGPKCLQLLGMHALVSSYPYGKEKISALNTLLAQDFPDMLGEVDTKHRSGRGNKGFLLYIASRGPACFKLFTKKKKNTPKVMALPPTSANLLQLALRAYLQAMLWKSSRPSRPTQ